MAAPPPIKVTLHAHALDRLRERGATASEVIFTVRHGRKNPAKFGRTRFTHVFSYNRRWLGVHYAKKQIEAFASSEGTDEWLVVTVIVKFY